MIDFKSNVVAGTVLVRSAIQSPNYVAGSAGWTINQDGTVEFTSGTFRGSLNAGNGAVLVNAGGVKVTGPNLQFDINFSGGFLARRIFDDGAYGQLSMASSTPGSPLGGGSFYNPPDPTPNGNVYSLTGSIYVQTDAVGALDRGLTIVRSPRITGKTDANIILRGELSDSSERRQVNVNGDFIVDDGIGHEEFVKFGGPTNVTNSIVPVNISGTTLVLEAGRSYCIRTYASYDGPVAADARWLWTKSSANLTGDRHISAPAASTTSNVDTTMEAIRRADGTAQITGTPNTVANGFSVYEETAFWTNIGATDELIQLQFAQGVANATPSVLQGGYIMLRLVA